MITRIKNSYSVPRGATARVYGATFGIGTGHVAICVEPGLRTDPLPRENASIPGEMKSIFGEVISTDMLSSLERTITHVGDLTREWTPVGTNHASYCGNFDRLKYL